MGQIEPIRPIHVRDYRILIAHSDTSLGDAIRLAFRFEGYESIIAKNAEEMFFQARIRFPHLLIAESGLFGAAIRRGVEAIKLARPNILVFLTAMPTDIEFAFQVAKQNVDGVVVVPVDIEHLVQRTGQMLVDKFGHNLKNGRATKGVLSLTPREQQVLNLITQGFSNKEVGLELDISPRTVEVHRARGMEKLGARNTAQLVRIYLNDQ